VLVRLCGRFATPGRLRAGRFATVLRHVTFSLPHISKGFRNAADITNAWVQRRNQASMRSG
jgi:hypothetical protein